MRKPVKIGQKPTIMVPVNEKTGETVPDADKTGENAQMTTILVLFNQYYVCHIHFDTRYAIMGSDADKTGESVADNDNTG